MLQRGELVLANRQPKGKERIVEHKVAMPQVSKKRMRPGYKEVDAGCAVSILKTPA